MARKYEGTCYIGVVGGESEIGQCRDSIEAIRRDRGDAKPLFFRGTKGYEVRQEHFNNWYENTKHPFMLLLDHDMIFPRNALRRLRANKLPFVSGLYMRRRYAPIAPVWFEYGESFPMIPFTGIPSPNQLYKIGASGWGCMLIHRDVVKATREVLRGEPDIIEDDMDVYPYDLKRIMSAIKSIQDDPAESQRVLLEEIRPLRGLHSPVVGSDIRYPFYARVAGFPLYGDSGVMCEHIIHYPISANDYAAQSAGTVRDVTLGVRNDVMKEVEKIRKATE